MIPFTTTETLQVESRYTLTGVFVTDAGRYRCSANSSVFAEAIESEDAQLQIMRKFWKYAISVENINIHPVYDLIIG